MMRLVHTRVAIVGSGFGVLGAVIRVQQDGVEDYAVLERADDVGGTWRDDTYPGRACDVASHLYSPVRRCADAIVRAIERRKRPTDVPRVLAPFAALGCLLVKPPMELLVTRQAAAVVPSMEKDVLARSSLP